MLCAELEEIDAAELRDFAAIDLAGSDLAAIDLAESDLAAIDLAAIDLAAIDLAGSDLAAICALAGDADLVELDEASLAEPGGRVELRVELAVENVAECVEAGLAGIHPADIDLTPVLTCHERLESDRVDDSVGGGALGICTSPWYLLPSRYP